MKNEELREQILLSAISLFNESGFKFTMDDIARRLSISKKTIYTVFRDKESLFLAMVDYLFDGIKTSEKAIVENDSLDVVTKVKRILGAMPECYSELDFRKLYELKDRFPKIYSQVEKRLESGWEDTFSLIEEGMKQGCIRKDININIVKTMMEATLEQFFQRDVLIRNEITYQEALNQVVSIIIDGIVI